MIKKNFSNIRIINCQRCGIKFSTPFYQQKYCGAYNSKTGCSYIIQKEKIKDNVKIWKNNNPDKILEYKKKYKNNPETRRAYNYKNTFDITIEEYNNLLKFQNNVCAICKQPETIIKRGNLIRLSIDHDHVSGKIRGLLCRRCNVSLGLLEDKIELLDACKEYLITKR